MSIRHKQPTESFPEVEATLARVLGSGPTPSPHMQQRIWHKARAAANTAPIPAGWRRWSRGILYPVLVLALLCGFFGGYAGVVLASGSSMPGDPLYVIEQTAETVWLSLTPASRKWEVELVLLERRVYETRALLEADKPLPPSVPQEIEVLLLGLAQESDRSHPPKAEILPHLLAYRQTLAQLVEAHPEAWHGESVLQAADSAIEALGEEVGSKE